MVETWGKHFVRNSPIAGSFARSPIRAVTTLTPLLRPARGGGRVFVSCAVTYVGNVGKALCAKQPNSRIFCKIPYSERSPLSPPCSEPAGEGGPRFYCLRGDLCWKRGESTLCETAQQPVLLQDPLPAAACRVERLDPRADVVPMVVVGPTRKHVLVDHARFIDIDPAADL